MITDNTQIMKKIQVKEVVTKIKTAMVKVEMIIAARMMMKPTVRIHKTHLLMVTVLKLMIRVKLLKTRTDYLSIIIEKN